MQLKLQYKCKYIVYFIILIIFNFLKINSVEITMFIITISIKLIYNFKYIFIKNLHRHLKKAIKISTK